MAKEFIKKLLITSSFVVLAGCSFDVGSLDPFSDSGAEIAEQRDEGSLADEVAAHEARKKSLNLDEIEGNFSDDDYPELVDVPSERPETVFTPQEREVSATELAEDNMAAQELLNDAKGDIKPAPITDKVMVKTEDKDVQDSWFSGVSGVKDAPAKAKQTEDQIDAAFEKAQASAPAAVQETVAESKATVADQPQNAPDLMAEPAASKQPGVFLPSPAQKSVAGLPQTSQQVALRPVPEPVPVMPPAQSVEINNVYGQKLAESFSNVSLQPVGLGVLQWQQNNQPAPPTGDGVDQRFVQGDVYTGKSDFKAANAAEIQAKQILGHVGTLFFLKGSASLTDQDMRILKNVADLYAHQNSGDVKVIGYASEADSSRVKQENMKVALQRASNIRSALKSYGVDEKRIKVSALTNIKEPGSIYGSSDQDDSERVEIFFSR